ncbi:hypothetical protein WL40_22405 [Burkholderia ubonensis]|nr:hypothetical protein WJ92_02085 [Burkholderia ubonensis]KWB84979.1 hypothetical protein WL40_22405 [Burkholderia ubonensis]
MKPERRQQVRAEQSRPLLAEIEAMLLQYLHIVLPEIAFGKALHYLHSQWPKLVRYVENGTWPISNNLCENSIRPFVVGRRNYLFCNTVAGANAGANLYSIAETCKANGVDVYQYLVALFKALPRAQTVDDYEALLAWAVAASSKKRLFRTRFAAGCVEQCSAATDRREDPIARMPNATRFHHVLTCPWIEHVHVGVEGQPTAIARRTLGFGAARMVHSVRVRYVVCRAEQINDIATQIPRSKFVVRSLRLRIGRNACVQAVVPMIEGRARSGTEGHKGPTRIRTLVCQIKVGGWIGNDIPDLDGGAPKIGVTSTQHGIALDKLAACRMSSKHDRLQVREDRAIRQVLENGIDHLE